MQYKLSDFMGKNIDVPEVSSALKSIERQMCSLPFESEPSEFLKVLSDWQSKKEHPEDNNGG